MSVVEKLIPSINRDFIKKLFVKFSSIYGHLWTSRHKTDMEWEGCCSTWLDALRKFTYQALREAIKDILLTYKEFPPTLGQMVDLCLRHAGVPCFEDAFKAAIRGDISHPVVSIAYHALGKWEMSHQKEDVLRKKFATAYGDAVNAYRANPTQIEEQYAAKPAIASNVIPVKIPNKSERKGFIENLQEWQNKAEEEKSSQEEIKHPTWEKSKTTIGSYDFDEKLFNERKRYLLSLDEKSACTLGKDEAYDRIRFIRVLEASKMISILSVNTKVEGNNENSTSSNYKPYKIYKDWVR